MREKKYLSMLILTLLASLAIVSVPPAQSSPSPVTFYVDRNPPTGYIPGQPVDETVVVDVYIDASELTSGTKGGIIQWFMDIQVDPSVLGLNVAKAGSGYFLYTYNSGATLLQGSLNNATGLWSGLSEAILPTPTYGAGGTGKLVTLNFTSKSATGYSWIDLIEGSCRYRDANLVWHDAEVVYGHYNSPKHLHSKSGLIDLTDANGTQWHEIYPTFCNNYTIDNWQDTNDDGDLGRCDQIGMIDDDTEEMAWFHVDNVTVTMQTTLCTGIVSTVNSPSSNGPGLWTNPTDAYTSNDVRAWCNQDTWFHQFGSYGFDTAIPGGATIISVKVGAEAYTATNEGIDVSCTWNNGLNWATDQTWSLPLVEATAWFDFTGAISWTPANLTDAKFQTRVTYNQAGGGAGGVNWLDWIPVNVTYWVLTTTTSSPSSLPTGAVWLNPTNAYTSSDTYASTQTDELVQEYGNYGFNIPGGATITKVEVGYEAYTDTNEEIGITCSWDGGSNWATMFMTGSLPVADPDAVTWVDFTGAITWTPGNLTDAKFRTAVKCNIKGGGGTGPVHLDWIPVRVTHTAYFVMYLEFEGNIQNFPWTNPASPMETRWHEIRPAYCNQYNITSFLIDSDASGNLTVCDGIILRNEATMVSGIAHVDGLATDIIVAYKYPQPDLWPEFPLGVALEIGLIVAIVYIWLRSRRKTKITKIIKRRIPPKHS